MLSIVSDTSARPERRPVGVPAKMTSSILPPRSVRAPWAPSTHATASTRFDLPEPFGPDDDGHARLELERRLVGERLEALQGESDLRNTCRST